MVYGIVLSGGSGKRIGADIPKQYIEVNGKPLLYHSLKAFEDSEVDRVSIVASQDYFTFVMHEIVEKYHLKKVIRVCQAGAERFNSVHHGIDDLSDVAEEEDIVLIHDGARPYITPEEINKIIEETKLYGAAIAASPSKDTIKVSDTDGFVAATTVRAQTWQIQTPQAFRYGLIRDAYNKACSGVLKLGGVRVGSKDMIKGFKENVLSAGSGKDASETDVTEKGALTREHEASGDGEKMLDPGKVFTDDSMVVEAIYPEQRIKLVSTSPGNQKITTPEDLEVAKARLK